MGSISVGCIQILAVKTRFQKCWKASGVPENLLAGVLTLECVEQGLALLPKKVHGFCYLCV